ncbi:MAG TPA: polynucleotide adenylyltransferase PcnB, partial [Chthoniobacteraceae bacterium]|nr:polynucleotide adenylyltransferase PcnB [Chthoniobacteraceae bacterium]
MPSPIETSARRIVQRLQTAGFTALYAGGCVRDMLRGHDPHDYDIATDAKPPEIERLFRRTI